ncbi:MAG: bifunctional glycosyltransferase family 2/GtrA family protein [Lachnospiraceae bacterium]|nr:bifunctional glycosyltransferase family 2/GtrA family protein [Lachnospiraceae bacterium]MBQ6196282.1 bifunctional glycosyltransferase family 2/GtrA family protein [Lachnospiraceae bacterium]
MNKQIVVIPAYEPGEKLPDLVKEAAAAGLIPVVVDDGSGKTYEYLFAQLDGEAAVLHHEENKGKGQALKTAFLYIKESMMTEKVCGPEQTVVVTMDCDGQHTVSDALKVLEAAEREPQALILGSRALKEKVPLRSRLGNDITRLVFRLASGTAVHDTQTGLRAFSGTLLDEMLEIPGERYEYEMNMLLRFAKEKRPIREVEIETIYIGKNNDTTHFDTLKDSWRIYKDILGFSASSFACFLLDLGLFAAFSALLKNAFAAYLAAANIGARVISSAVNYTLNRNLVFKSKAGVAKSAAQYFLLAAGILAGNTLVLNVLVNILGVARIPAKLLTEALFFLISWTVQRRVIFRKKKEDNTSGLPLEAAGEEAA